jgi:succinate dehydrogenase / fumarate reductase iron-sulfur subunit
MEEVTLVVQRFDPLKQTKPTFREYKVPNREGLTMLDAILYARDYTDHSIALRFSCRMASCGSCGMKINGRPSLACETLVANLGKRRIVVQPMDNFPVIRDLVVDLDPFFRNHRSIRPQIKRADAEEIENPSGEYLMTAEQLESILQFTYCIKCGLCTSSCPTISTDSLFPGPQALAQAHRFLMDVRDEAGEERMNGLDTEHGVWRCHMAGSCSSVCPKGVDPALGIQLLKRHIMLGRPARGKGEGSRLLPRPQLQAAPKT